MSEIKILETVAKAINHKHELIPVLKTLHFYDGRVQATGDHITIDGPYPREGKPVNLPADKFIAALKRMPDGKFNSKDNVLTVRQGNKSAKMPISVDHFPRCEKPEGWFNLPDNFVECLRIAKLFITKDSPKPWTISVCWESGFMYATNNVTLIRQKCDIDPAIGVLTIPIKAVDLILKMGRKPLLVHNRPNAAAIEFEGDVWMEFSKVVGEWPMGQIHALLDGFDFDNLSEIDGIALAHEIKELVPFSVDTTPAVFLESDRITTSEGHSGATTEMKLPTEKRVGFYAEAVVDVLNLTKRIGLDNYPKAIPFSGDGLDGCTMGISVR